MGERQADFPPGDAVSQAEDLRAQLAEERHRRRTAEAALDQQQALLEAALSAAPLFVWAADAEGIITSIQGRGLRPLPPGVALGANLFTLAQQQPDLLDAISRALGGERYFCEVVSPDGRVCDTHYLPLPASNGRPPGMVCVGMDMTERAQAENELRLSNLSFARLGAELEGRLQDQAAELEAANVELSEINLELERQLAAQEQLQQERAAALREAEQRAAQAEAAQRLLDGLMEQIPIGITIADAPDVTTRRVSRFGLEITARSAAELENLPLDAQSAQWGLYLLDEDRLVDPERLPLTRATKHGELVRDEELRLRRGDGAEIFILCNAGPIRNAAGEIVAGVIAWQDISERRRAQVALQNSERRLRTILETVPVGIWLTDATGRIVYGNPAAERIWQGARWVSPESYHEYKGWWAESGRQIGAEDWALNRALRHGETSQNELIEIECFDGAHKTILNSASPILNEEGLTIAAIAVNEDVTALHLVTSELQRSEARIRRLVEGNIVGVIYSDAFGGISEANDAFLNLLGYSRDDLDAGLLRWDGLTPPEYLRLDQEKIEEARRDGACHPYEKEYYHRDGRRIPILFGYAILDDPPDHFVCFVVDLSAQKELEHHLAYQALVLDSIHDAVIATDTELRITSWNRAAEVTYGIPAAEALGRYTREVIESEFSEAQRQEAIAQMAEAGSYQVEVKQRRRDGGVIYTEGTNTAIRDAQGEVIGYVGANRDVTDRHAAQEAARVYAAELERSNRDLQDFAFIVSHDLREPLRKIISFGEVLKRNYAPALGEEGRDYIDRMQNASDRLSIMIDDLLAYARVPTHGEAFSQVDLNAVLAEIRQDLGLQIECSGGQVQIEALPQVYADGVQMRQLFQNLLSNALKYHRPDTPPQITVRGHIEDGWAEISVQDNGIGFDMAYVGRIFQPFQRLHGRSQYEGSGIGLAICRRIIERHHGEISAQSVPGEGATFRVRIPLSQETSV